MPESSTRYPELLALAGRARDLVSCIDVPSRKRGKDSLIALWSVAWFLIITPLASDAKILWSDLGQTSVHDTGPGQDILGGAVRRDASASDALYFKFHVSPLSDLSTEPYFAGFQLFEGEDERLGVGNAYQAWAYSAFNVAGKGSSNSVFGEFDLQTARPEPYGTNAFWHYELPRRGIEQTIVFKVQYVSGTNALVTVWLNPDLAPEATEAGQPASLTTHFSAKATFDQIRIRQGGGGQGWIFSDMAIATSFSDLVGVPSSSALPLTFRSWQREQGLPQNAVRALAQTPDGYLWIGSDDGVARFDGVRFVSFGLREGLRSGRITALLADSRGALWIGTAGGGLTRWEAGVFTTFTVADGLPADSITALAQDGQGRIWVGTESGLACWLDGRATPAEALAQFKDHVITDLFKDAKGTMWLAASGLGVFQFAAGQFIQFIRLADPQVDDLLHDAHCVLADRAGRLWIGVGDDFVLCREEPRGEIMDSAEGRTKAASAPPSVQWRRYRIPRHLARPYVSTLAEEVDGTVWAGSQSEGLFQFKEGKLNPINASSGLSDNTIESLLIDREGNLWVGTASGLNRLRHKNLVNYGPTEGLGYGPVQGLAEIVPGQIWAGKPSDGLYRWDGRRFSSRMLPGLPRGEPQVNALLLAADGSCWLGCAAGLLRFAKPSEEAPQPEVVTALAGRNVLSLAAGADGGLWAGTREGELWRLQDGAWAAQTNSLKVHHPIASLATAADGSVWIGTEGSGLYLFKDFVRSHLDRASGLLSELVRALYLDSQGTLWIGTSGGGLGRWREGRIMAFTTREGLPDNTISQILEDDLGRLWLGCNRGIACLAKRDLEDLANRKIAAVYPRVYGNAEGMVSEECAGGFCPSGLRTRSGQLWFPTRSGIVAAQRRPQGAEAPAPQVVLEEVLVDRAAVAAPELAASLAGAPLRIAPGKRRFEFRYTGLSFSAPERVRFRCRLEPLDAEWVEAGTSRTAYYPYVPPGDYRFRVIACNSDGVWSEGGAALALIALPYFWQTRWFLGLGVLGLSICVAGTARVVEKRRLHRRLQTLEQERALERERTRIAQDLHDDLGSSLTRISLLSDLVKADKDQPGQTEAHAEKLAQTSAHTVRALEEIVWALRPGSDSLQSLIEYIAHFANELFQGDGARCRLDFPHDLPARSLPPEMRHNIFLVVKEALTNAFKHAGAKEVQVQAKVSASSLEVLVRDDGLGFDPISADGHRHGLGNMRRRAQTMGGTLAVQSAKGQGTEIRLNVQLPSGSGNCG